jgi:hypothetical protein
MSHDSIKQAQSALQSLLKVFAAAFITTIITTGQIDSWTTLKAAFYAGVGSVLVVTLNWIDPNDTRYGIGYVPK